MKERPILFSAPMVRALLDGSKTQTRRVVQSQPESDEATSAIWVDIENRHQWAWTSGDDEEVLPNEPQFFCPYGQPGDRLWVRETWNSSGLNWRKPIRDMRKVLGPVHYSADPEHGGWMPYWGPMKPSIHMPRWASRITLEITGVRVERLHAINEVDAIAEGAPWAACGSPQDGSHKAGYAKLWESINGDRSWDQNPWVWVIEFKRIEQVTP